MQKLSHLREVSEWVAERKDGAILWGRFALGELNGTRYGAAMQPTVGVDANGLTGKLG